MNESTDDQALIASSLKGDADAFEALVRRHQAFVLGTLWRLIPDRTSCEELLQDTFVKAYYALRSYRGQAPLNFWLRRIALRLAYAYLKARNRRGTYFVQTATFEGHQARGEVGLDSLEAAERRSALYAWLDRLSVRDRMVLSLKYFEDMEVKEIACELGWSVTLVKVQLLRARSRLKKLIEQDAQKGGHQICPRMIF